MYIREVKIVYLLEQEIKAEEVQTFIWYTTKWNYNEFNIYFFDETFTLEFRNSNFQRLINERLDIPPVSKTKFENRRELGKSPIKVKLKQKDFHSVMDTRYQKMRFELDLKLNLEPKNYLWCIESEEKQGFNHRSVNDSIETESNYYQYKTLYAHWGKIKIR